MYEYERAEREISIKVEERLTQTITQSDFFSSLLAKKNIQTRLGVYKVKPNIGFKSSL